MVHVDGDREHIRAIIEACLRSIAVMDIPVDHSNLLRPLGSG